MAGDTMKLSDKIISAAIRYQTAVSRYQAHTGYDFDADKKCQDAFNTLVKLAEQADRLEMRDDITPESDVISKVTPTGDTTTIHTFVW